LNRVPLTEALAVHSSCTFRDKGTYLLAVLQQQAAGILHRVPSGAICENMV
jgi:hypothetical protein